MNNPFKQASFERLALMEKGGQSIANTQTHTKLSYTHALSNKYTIIVMIINPSGPLTLHAHMLIHTPSPGKAFCLWTELKLSLSLNVSILEVIG